MSYVKNEIAEIFSNLRKFNYQVRSFGTKSRLTRGMKGSEDVHIRSLNLYCIVEIKTAITLDKKNELQETNAKILSSLSYRNPDFFYFEISNLDEAKQLHDAILKHKVREYSKQQND